jgi:hypothetical protein
MDDGALGGCWFAVALIRLVTVEPIHTCLSFTKNFERKFSSSFKHPFLRETENLGFVGLALVGKDIMF